MVGCAELRLTPPLTWEMAVLMLPECMSAKPYAGHTHSHARSTKVMQRGIGELGERINSILQSYLYCTLHCTISCLRGVRRGSSSSGRARRRQPKGGLIVRSIVWSIRKRCSLYRYTPSLLIVQAHPTKLLRSEAASAITEDFASRGRSALQMGPSCMKCRILCNNRGSQGGRAYLDVS